MKILIVGLPMFARKLAADLSAYDRENTYVSCDTYYSSIGKLKYLFHLPTAHIVHSINGSICGSKVFDLAIRTRKKLMMHWVGTDVLKSAKNLENNLVNKDFVDKASHFCEPEWIKEELISIGIKAKLLTFTTLNTDSDYVRDNPKGFSVLSYIGNNREDFYGFDNLLNLANEFPSVTFNIVGTTEKEHVLPVNINMLGWVDNIYELYKNNILYLRLTEHDGLSSSVLEAMSCGCHVMWTCKFPHAFHASTYKQLSEQFRVLMLQFDSGKLEVNQPGVDYIKEHFERTKVLHRLKDVYKRLITSTINED